MASTSDADTVRRLLYGGSTRTGTLSTADINWHVDNAANVYLAASYAAAGEAAAYAGGITSKNVGDLSLSYGDRAASFTSLSKSLRVMGIRKGGVKPFSGGISESARDSAETDTDWERPSFSVGMNDNPQAGNRHDLSPRAST